MSSADKTTIIKDSSGRPAFFRWVHDTGRLILALLGVWFFVTGFAEAGVRALRSFGALLNGVDLSAFNHWSLIAFIVGGVLVVAIQNRTGRIPH